MNAGIFARLGQEVLMDQAIAAEKLPKPIDFKADVWADIETVDGEKIRAYVVTANGRQISLAVADGTSYGVRDIAYTSVKSFKAGGTDKGGSAIDWTESPTKFTFTVNPEMQEELKQAVADGKSQQALGDLFEGLIGNSDIDWIQPEEVGALTDAPIFGHVERDDQGKLTDTGHVWWYPNYMVSDPIEELAEKGTVTFEGSPENLGGGAARENTSEMQPSSFRTKPSIVAAPPKAPAEPASRGKAPQEEDMTEEAKKATEVKKTPPATLERMKQGPKSITKDVATATPEANEAQSKAVEAVLAYEGQVQSLQKSIAGAISVLQKSLGEKKTGLASALETLYSLVEREANKAIKYKTDIIAVDAKREVKEANLTPGAEKKALEIIEKLDKRKAEIKDLNAELEALTMEQFRKHGGTETELQRVTTFPNPTLKSSMVNALTMLGKKNTVAIRAGILDMIKSLVSKFKGIFDDGLDQDIASFTSAPVAAKLHAAEEPYVTAEIDGKSIWFDPANTEGHAYWVTDETGNEEMSFETPEQAVQYIKTGKDPLSVKSSKKIKASENPEAESLMADFSEAEQEIADMRQGEEIDRKFDEAHKAELMEAMKASIGDKKFGREVYEAIEDENYHFLNELLTELGAYKP